MLLNNKYLCSLLLAVLFAASIPAGASSFLQLDPTKCYRLVHRDTGGTGIALGANHGSDWQICYLPGEVEAADAWWYPELNGTKLALRNASTGQYITYTPGKDYQTYQNAELTTSATTQSYWNIYFDKGGVCFTYKSDVEYYLSYEKDSQAIKANKGSKPHDSNIFEFVDQEGTVVALPYPTPFVNHIDNFALDGKRVPYDSYNKCFLFPVQGYTSGTYTPAVSFTAVDDATYTVVRADGSALSFTPEELASTTRIELRRDGVTVAEANIQFTMLPVVEISGKNINDTEYIFGSTIVTDTDPQRPTIESESKLRWRGATAINYPKHSYNIKFVDANHEKISQDVLGLRNENSWILDGMAIDRVKMRNRVLFDIWNQFARTPYDTEFGGRNGTVGRFVELLVNGEYQGIYCLSDKIDRKLLDLKKVKEDTETGDITIRGLLYKSNSWDYTTMRLEYLSDNLDMNNEDWNNWELQYPEDYPCAEAWTPLYDLYKLCSDDARFKAEYEKTFYMESVVDFHVFVLAYSMTDNGNKNMFLSFKNLSKPEENKFLITPWDLDTSLGGGYDGRYYDGTYETISVAEMRINQNSPFKNLWDNNYNNYRSRMANRWAALRDSYFSAENLAEKMQTYTDLFNRMGSWRREVARWPNGAPVVENLQAEVDGIVAWYRNHIGEMNTYFQPYFTGIEGIEIDTPAATTGIYNAAGIRVADNADALRTLPAGFYIVNGEKTIKR